MLPERTSRMPVGLSYFRRFFQDATYTIKHRAVMSRYIKVLITMVKAGLCGGGVNKFKIKLNRLCCDVSHFLQVDN